VSVVNINAVSHDETFVPVKTSLNPNTNIDGVPKFTQRCNADAWCTVATEAETAAFGYLSRALGFEQRVLRRGPLAIRYMRRRNGERRSHALKSRRGLSFPISCQYGGHVSSDPGNRLSFSHLV
jgi:hypothetical protein